MSMLRSIALILAFLPAVAWGQARVSTAPAQPGIAGCNFVNCVPGGNRVVFAAGQTYGGVTAVGGAQQTRAVVCFSNNSSTCPSPTNQISLLASGNFTSSTTVTVTQGSNTITLGSALVTQQMTRGTQIRIPGLGPGGADYVGHIVTCNNVNPPCAAIGVDIPVSTAWTVGQGALNVTFGTQFPSNIQYIMVQSWSAAQNLSGRNLTVSSVNSATNLTLSSAAGNVVNGGVVTLIMSPADDSVAMSNACAQAMGTPEKTLYVQGQFYVPGVLDTCYQVVLRAADTTAAIYTGAGYTPNTVGATNGGSHKEFLIPVEAPSPSPPIRKIAASYDLPVSKAAQPSPIWVDFGDSLETPMPNNINGTGTYGAALQRAFLRDNAGMPFGLSNHRDCGVGGLTTVLQDGNPAATDFCWTSTATTYVTQLAAMNPTTVAWGIGNNDGIGFSFLSFADIFWRTRFNLASQFTVAPDFILKSHHPYSRSSSAGSGLVVPESQLFGPGIMRSFADVMSNQTKYLDGANEGIKHVWGWDMKKPKLERDFSLNYGVNATLPLRPTHSTHGGYAIALSYSDNNSTFWSRMTGNGGVTDARGPVMIFLLSTNNVGGSGLYDNLFFLFYNTGTNLFSYECDPDVWHPGLGCRDPATGVPPVTPSLKSSITVANTGAGGNAVVTAATPAFFSCVEGGTVAIPKAGANHAPAGYADFSYTEPLIAHVAVAGCVSSTEIDLDAPAVSTYSSQTGAISFGNPVISTSVTDVGIANGYSGNTGSELVGFQLAGDYLQVWSQVPNNPIFDGYIMRWDGPEFVPGVFSGGLQPAIQVSTNTYGGTTYQTGDYEINLPDYVEFEETGPSAVAPMSNSPAYIGPGAGDGNNHNTARFGSGVIDPLFAVNNFNLGGGGVASVTSGASATISSCLVGTVNVNDTTAPTITIPAYCTTPLVIQDSGGNAAAHTITVAPPSGLTLNGSTTITSNYGRRTVSWTSLTSAVIQ